LSQQKNIWFYQQKKRKRLVATAKFLDAATKKLFVVPNFVVVTKPFFSVHLRIDGCWARP